jgi:hypothetical protein
VLKRAKHLDHGIGQILVMQVDGVDAAAFSAHDAARYADDRALRGHVVDYHRASANLAAVPNRDVAEYRRANTHHHAVLQRRMPLAVLLPVPPSVTPW